MKCRNCGADVDAEALKCPYCETKNPGGIRFWQRVRIKHDQNLRLKKKVLDESREGILNRILNRTMFTLLIVLILTFGISFWTFYFFSEGNHLFAPSDCEEVMQELYEEGDYLRLHAYMLEYDLTGEKYSAYSRVSWIAFDYTQFLNARNEILHELETGEMPEEYEYSALIERAYRVLYPTYPKYESQETDRKYTEDCSVIVRDSLAVLFGFGEEELALMEQNSGSEFLYLTGDAREQLVETAMDYIEKGGVSE